MRAGMGTAGRPGAAAAGARAILSGEDVVRISARDAFDRAEKMEALEDAARFIRIAQLRRRLAHEHPMDDAARATRVNDAYALAPALLDEFDRLAAYAARFTEGDAR